METRFEEYRTAEGDTVDLIAFRRFGTSKGTTEAILDANPGLAALGVNIPAGTIIKIPVPEIKDRRQVGRIWN